MPDEDVAQRVRVETLAWGSSQPPEELLEEVAGCAGVEGLSCPAGVYEEVDRLLILQQVTLQPEPLSAPRARRLRCALTGSTASRLCLGKHCPLLQPGPCP